MLRLKFENRDRRLSLIKARSKIGSRNWSNSNELFEEDNELDRTPTMRDIQQQRVSLKQRDVYTVEHSVPFLCINEN